MMRSMTLFVSILLVLLGCVPVFADPARVVRVGAFYYYPAIFKDKDGTIKGFYVDALTELAERENIRFEYVYGSWSEGLQRITTGEVDLLTSAAFTPERAEFLDYAKTPLQTVWGELYASPTTEIHNIREVQGKKIAVMQGDFNGRNFMALIHKFDLSCEFVEMPDFETIFQAIAAKEVDAGVVNNIFGAAKQHEFGLRSTGVVFNPFDIFFVVAKGKNADLLTLLDEYLHQWLYHEESTYSKALQRWSHGSTTAREVTPPWLLHSLAALACLIILFLLFIVLLKRQVRRATKNILQNKEVLRASEAKFRSYIDHSPDGIFVIDENGRHLEVNPAASDLTGYTQEELLQMSVPVLTPPEFQNMARAHFQTLKETGFCSAELALVHKSGSRRWWRIDAVKLSATRYLGFAKDLTTRWLAEEELRNSELRHRTILQTAIDGFWRVDLLGRFLEVNETYCRMSGYSVQELLSMRIPDVVENESDTAIAARIQRIIAQGEDRFVSRHKRKDGTLFDVEVSVKYQLIDGGQMVVFVQDITARKQAEAYLKMGREVLQVLNEPGEMDDLIKQALSKIKELSGFSVGIRLQEGDDFPYLMQEGFPQNFLLKENSLMVRGRDGGICRDPAGNLCLECTCGRVISGTTDASNLLFTPGGSAWTNNSFRLLDLPSELDSRGHPRNECVHQGYASVAMVPIRSNDQIMGLIQFNDRHKDRFTLETVEFFEGVGLHFGAAIMRKRSEAEKLAFEQQFQQTQKLEGLGVLASGIAHDFNNILAMIMGSCFLGQEDESTARDQFSRIEEAAQRGAEICRQMLSYAGKTKSPPTQVDVSLLVDEMMKLLQVSIPKNVTIKLAAPPELPSVLGDNSQISQVVMNLIINAAEAIGDAQGEVHVCLDKVIIDGASPEKDHLGKEIAPGVYLCLEVADNGCGMSDEVRRRLFEPFYTTKFTGRGLGLSATLGIIMSHNGALQLSSQPGQGSDFKVYLPAQFNDATRAAASPQTPVAQWRGSGTILLVDDEEAILLAVSAMLKTLGFTVITAADGKEALELYRQNAGRIDLVLTDMGMPVMNGQELILELKKIAATLPIIISSGFGESDISKGIVEEEIAGILNKPYHFDQLRTVLKSVIEHRLPKPA